MVQSRDNGGGDGDDEKISPQTQQDVTNSELRDTEKGTGSGNAKETGQYAQIDPAIASRIAASVDDFMVSLSPFYLDELLALLCP